MNLDFIDSLLFSFSFLFCFALFYFILFTKLPVWIASKPHTVNEPVKSVHIKNTETTKVCQISMLVHALITQLGIREHK